MNRFARRSRAMTLAEVLVATFLLAMFGLAAFSSLSLAMRQWNQVGQRVNAVQNARYVTSEIAKELKTAIPCPVATIGYQTISPALGIGNTTAVLKPNFNAAQQTSNTLVFTKPNPATYDPTQATWTITAPNIYKKVQWTVSNTTPTNVTRTSWTYSSGGAQTQESAEVVASGSNITLQCVWLSDSIFNVSVSAQEGPYVSTYNNTVMVLGQ